MRDKTDFYLYFFILLIPSFLIGLFLKQRFGIAIRLPEAIVMSEAGWFASLAHCYVAMMRLPLLIFCTGFTVFAPYCASAAMLYLGLGLGAWWQEAVLPDGLFGVLAGLTAALLLTVFVFLCGQAASHRLYLRTSAPAIGTILRSRGAWEYLTFFLGMAAVYLACAAILLFGSMKIGL